MGICAIIKQSGDVMKLIGIVGRVYYNKDKQEIVQLNDCLRRVLAEYDDVSTILLLPPNSGNYLNDVVGNGIIVEEDRKKLNYILNKCDGFVVPGGTYWYNFDEYVINYAIDNRKPLLGICLGFQCLCSMFAKDRDKFDMTKRFNIDKHYGNPLEYIHGVKILNNTLLSKILNSDKIRINSIHHDYVDFPMNKLKIAAVSDDGVIEAVEYPESSFLLGVQWHPEYLMDDNSRKIFDNFVNSIK